ncbi:MAG: toxic anion resistance protein [Candidatus Nitrosotenuis sp.]
MSEKFVPKTFGPARTSGALASAPEPGMPIAINQPTKESFKPVTQQQIRATGTTNPKATALLMVIDSPTGVLDFGRDVMDKIAQHSEQALEAVQDADVTFVHDQITNIISMAKSIGTAHQNDNKKKSWSLGSLLDAFRDKTISLKEQVEAQFSTVSQQMDKVITQVDEANTRIINKLSGLQTLYKQNLDEYTNLSQLIIAAEEAYRVREQQIASLKMEAGTDMAKLEEIKRSESALIRLDKKITNLKKFQLMAIQNAPDISQMMDDAITLIDKFHDIKTMTMPLWKRNVRKYIDSLELKKASDLERTINDANNQMMIASSDQLKVNAIATANANNRDVVDDKTLEHIHGNLIDMLSEVAEINNKGIEQRRNSVERMDEMTRMYGNIASGRQTAQEAKKENDARSPAAITNNTKPAAKGFISKLTG